MSQFKKLVPFWVLCFHQQPFGYAMKKIALLLLLLVYGLPELLAQNHTVSGQILAEDTHVPLAGVNIWVKGSSSSGISNEEGHYQIDVPIGASLVFSLSGFVSLTLTPESSKTTNIRLTPVGAVAIGYGMAAEHTLTSAIASLPIEEDRQDISLVPQQLLQGRLAGVQVNTASSEPGADARLIIRGISAVNGVAPLFVIDGMPLSDYQTQAFSTDLGLGTAPPQKSTQFYKSSRHSANRCTKRRCSHRYLWCKGQWWRCFDYHTAGHQ